MKLYHHYKNKPYRYQGIARHSETLEEVVVYECLYENPSGKLWVRPKDMFFSQVSGEGGPRARFQKIDLQITETTTVTEAKIARLAPLIKTIFGEWDPDWFNQTFQKQNNFYLVEAQVLGKLVGFKLGYELSSEKFYSWLGGVRPDFQRLGIAQAMMQAQHKWCQTQGYRQIQTKTQNRFRSMLLLNLAQGFDVVGTHPSDEGGLKIVMEKNL